MSSESTVAVTAIWTDDQNTIKGDLLGSSNTVAMAVGILGNHISKHMTKVYGLDPPLNPLAMRAKYFPDVQPSDMLNVCRPNGLTAIFSPNVETNRRIKTQLAQKAQANQISVETNTALATNTATTSQSSTQAAPSRRSRRSKKRNAASAANPVSTANPASTSNLPQVTMDVQLKEMLASMQNEIVEMRGKNDRILNENGSMRNEIESIRNKNESILNENESIRNKNERILNENGSMRNEIERILNENGSMRNEIERISNENESINNDLASVRNDLNAARVKHSQDVEALKEITMLLVPLHLRVLLDLARKKVLEHLGHETWEDLRASRSVYQLADTICNDLKQKGVSYPPSSESIFFLCSYNNIRRAGNTAAHSAKEDDVRHAVLTQSLESRDRRCLESLFTYAYNGVPV
ncbi:uncharacterized protein F5147DRAFT_668523 [Suillus discolor]|uniref:Uncharacterized protein n=1 Tax=Suillus discolor TaxID=1912936 RepID=A0A9P7K093_9AGAM|nr:uncharacterized protein F5147DRAFT_668523 [Suillus discolor]KAG2119168.1 hypothetical protein F5147DRAFT_668523 [Suillus discolor]